MLETCRNTYEVVKFIANAKRREHDGILTIADPEDNIKTFEISSFHVAVREMADTKVANTNHHQTAEMRQHEAQYYKSSGLPGYRSSPNRLKGAEELLENKAIVDESLYP